MKTTISIEIESKDELIAKLEKGGPDEGMGEVNIAKDFHDEVIGEIKKVIETFVDDFPEGIDDNYIENYDTKEYYGLKITVK